MWNQSYYPYIIFSILISAFLIYIFIRLKYGFWFYQPVFHFYDLKYYFFPPGIINHGLPEKNKYTNFKNIDTISFEKVSDLKMNQFINFIQLHYLQNKYNKFLPKKENIVPYFSNLNAPVFFSFYYEDILLNDSKTNEPIRDKEIVSVTTGKPLHVKINNGSADSQFYAYYVDYLCVAGDYRKKGIAPMMIQTHHYNQSHLNKDISVSLFKREGELTGIVPLCVFSTYGFSMKRWNRPDALPPNLNVLECTASNFHFLVDFLKERKRYFDIFIIAEYGNILGLIKSGNIFIHAVLQNDQIQCVYFFRKTCIFVDKNEEVVTCFASVNGSATNEIFIQGFKNSLYKIIKKNKTFKCCAIENISHNDTLVQNICLKTKPFIVSPTAYFFYNFAYPTFKSNKAFVLC
jgi:hypothetical protein